MSLTNYAENAILNHIFGNTSYSQVSTVYVALSSTDAGEDASGWTEATYGSYTRKAITFGAAASRAITQSGTVTFPKSTSGDETYGYYAIFDASSGGNMLAYGSLNNDINVVVNSTPSIASGEVVISVNAGSGTGMSDYLANALLEFMFKNTSYAQPSIYVALVTATVSDSDTGSTVSDPAGNNYARKAFSDWSTATTGTLNNNTNIQFNTPSGSWGTIVATALCDDLNAGNMLMYDNTNVVDQAVGLNDDVKFLAGQFVTSLN